MSAPASSQRTSRPRSASRVANSSNTRPGDWSTQSPSLSLTAPSAAEAVIPWPTEVAGQRRSGGNSAGSIDRLRPIPITAQSGGRASTRTPAAFSPRSRRRSATSPDTPARPAPRPPRRRRAAPRAEARHAPGPAGAGSPNTEAPCRAEPPKPAPSGPGRSLLLGGDHRAAGRPLERQLAGALVRRVDDSKVAARRAEGRHTTAGAGRPRRRVPGSVGRRAAAIHGQSHAPVGVQVEEQLAIADLGEGEREHGLWLREAPRQPPAAQPQAGGREP